MDRADRPPRQGPLWLSIISVALIVAAVIGALAATQRLTLGIFGAPALAAISSSLTIPTDTTAGLAAPQRAYFSPDGSRIAVIGAFTPCHQDDPGLARCGHGLAIFSASTGALIQVSPIEPLLGVSEPTDGHRLARGSSGYTALTGLGWSPDSAWFALVYSVFDTPTPMTPDEMPDSGLLLINPQTGATRIIRGDSGYFAALGGAPAAHPIWRLVGPQPQTPGVAPEPGLIYAWGGNGLPFPTVPLRSAISELPANAGPRYPVGSPDGAAPFTIWQPGLVIGPGSAGVGSGRSAFVTTFASWSADDARLGEITAGVALPTPVRADGALSAPAGTPGPSIAEPATLVQTPARDVALTHVQEAVGAYGWASVAWNPAGTMLASVTCFASGGGQIQVRDTVSGALIGQAALHLAANDPGCRDATNVNLHLTWAPDGSTLMTTDAAASTITFWRIHAPAS